MTLKKTESTARIDQLKAAKQALKLNIQRRKKKGQEVEVLKQPYDLNVEWVRCVLSIDGVRTRLVYLPEQHLWKKSG